MGSAIPLRDDFDGPRLRLLARQTKDAAQARRLLALGEIYDGASRGDAARIGSVTLQIIRDWVLRFNQRGPAGLINGKAPGNRPMLSYDQRRALARIVEDGPIPAIHGVVRWRRKDLAKWIFEEFAISVDETTVGRELKALGFAKLSARPRHHAQNEFAVEEFKKLPRRAERDQGRTARRNADRAVVGRRGPHRPEEQAHAALGETGYATLSAARSAHKVGLHLRRHLPGKGQGRRSRHAILRHRRHGRASARDQSRC